MKKYSGKEQLLCIVAILGAMSLFAGLVLFGTGTADRNVFQKLTQDGVKTEATVVNREERRSGKNSKNRWVQLQFRDAELKEHTHWSGATPGLWNKAIGETVAVNYLRTDPTTFRLVGDEFRWEEKLSLGKWLVLGGVIVLVVAVPSFLAARRKRATEPVLK